MKQNITTHACGIMILLLLSNCVQSTTALFGPAVTLGQTGNIYHGGLSYISSDIIRKQTGKNPIEYVKDIVINSAKKNKPNHIVTIKKNLLIEQTSLNIENNDDAYNSFVSAVKKNLN